MPNSSANESGRRDCILFRHPSHSAFAVLRFLGRSAKRLRMSRTLAPGHHDHQITQAQFEARVPAHTQNDNLRSKCRPLNKSAIDTNCCISSSSPGTERVCTRTPQGGLFRICSSLMGRIYELTVTKP